MKIHLVSRLMGYCIRLSIMNPPGAHILLTAFHTTLFRHSMNLMRDFPIFPWTPKILFSLVQTRHRNGTFLTVTNFSANIPSTHNYCPDSTTITFTLSLQELPPNTLHSQWTQFSQFYRDNHTIMRHPVKSVHFPVPFWHSKARFSPFFS